MTNPHHHILSTHSRNHRTFKAIYLISFVILVASTAFAKADDANKPRRHKHRVDHSMLYQRKYGPFRLYLVIIIALLAGITLVIAGWCINANILVKRATKLLKSQAGS